MGEWLVNGLAATSGRMGLDALHGAADVPLRTLAPRWRERARRVVGLSSLTHVSLSYRGASAAFGSVGFCSEASGSPSTVSLVYHA